MIDKDRPLGAQPHFIFRQRDLRCLDLSYKQARNLHLFLWTVMDERSDISQRIYYMHSCIPTVLQLLMLAESQAFTFLSLYNKGQRTHKFKTINLFFFFHDVLYLFICFFNNSAAFDFIFLPF